MPGKVEWAPRLRARRKTSGLSRAKIGDTNP